MLQVPSEYETAANKECLKSMLPSPRKTRIVNATSTKINKDTNKTIILALVDIKVRRHPLKVIRAMQENSHSMNSLTNLGDNCIQTLIEDFVKPNFKLRDYKLSNLETHQLLLVKSDIFQLDRQINLNSFHFGHSCLGVMSRFY